MIKCLKESPQCLGGAGFGYFPVFGMHLTDNNQQPSTHNFLTVLPGRLQIRNSQLHWKEVGAGTKHRNCGVLQKLLGKPAYLTVMGGRKVAGLASTLPLNSIGH